MISQNEDKELLDYFTTLPKRSLDQQAKERILQELQHAEQSIKHKRKRTFWADGIATISIVTTTSCFLFLSGYFQKQGMEGFLSHTLFARQNTNKQSSIPNMNDVSSQANDSKPSEQNTQMKEQILNILNTSKNGKVPNVGFAADNATLTQVEQEWGKADSTEKAGAGHYATYTKNNIVFGFNINKNNLIFDVRSYEPSLKRISNAEVVSTLGAPDDIRYAYGQEIVVYKVSPTFELEWVFSALSKQNPNPALDHISVYCQKDAEILQNNQ